MAALRSPVTRKRSSLTPNLLAAYRNLARVLTQIGEEKAATECWYQALTIEPTWGGAQQHFKLGNTLLKQGKSEQAIVCYRQAIELNPNFSLAYQRLGEVLSQQKQPVANNAQNAQYYYSLGRKYAKEQQWDKAISSYQKATELQPNSWEIHHYLGDALLQLYIWPFATRSFRRAIELNPDFPRSHYNLGFAYLQQEDWENAVIAYRRAFELQPDLPDLDRKLAYALHQRAKADIETAQNIYKLKDPIEEETESTTSLQQEKLVLSKSDRPTVSVIIYLLNQIETTLKCLQSLSTNIKSYTSIEVIVVNDSSTNSTKEILQQVEGLVVVNNSEKLGFIHSCNKAASLAKGEYLYFLDSNAEIRPNCLESLIDVFLKDKHVGAVGSKLLYPDGSLKEAGGIIWNDASCYSYGKGASRSDPQYNYLRPVDYCSGASLMVKKESFQSLGGFEINFVPAYYQDIDLCFALRKYLQLSVIYQPKSEVIHHESEQSSDIQRYQVVNKHKFKQKWQQEFLPHPSGSVENIPRSSRKYLGDFVILIITSYVPIFDRESESRRLFELIKIFKELKYHVILAADNGLKTEPYTSKLQDLQVEVLYTCDDYQIPEEQQIRARLPLLDLVWICGSDIHQKYAPIIRQQPQIKIIYDTIDLPSLSMKKASELSSEDIKKGKQFTNMQGPKLSIAQQADLTVTVTEAQRKNFPTGICSQCRRNPPNSSTLYRKPKKFLTASGGAVYWQLQ